MSNQGTVRLKVLNDSASVEKLWNGRFRLEFLCDNNGAKNDWYYDNISGILPDYGILQNASFGTGVGEDWQAIPESVYPDMRLVETDYVFIPSLGDKRVQLAYETLTASWVEEKAEDIDYELNGLKRVSRAFVALPATPYTYVIGTTTITSNGTTLHLANFKVEKTDAKWELSEVWIERGTLSVDLSNEAEGILRNTYTFFGAIGTTVGPIVSQKIGDFQGYQTIIVATLTDKDGNPLGASGSPVNQFDQYINFRYPGEVSIATDVDTINNPTTGDVETTWNSHWYSLIPPVTSQINARVYVFFQTENTIVADDLVYDGAVGLWNPKEWAKGRVDGLGSNFSQSTIRQTAQDKVFNEYTTVAGGSNSVSGTAEYANTGTGAVLLEGTQMLVGATYSLSVTGGPGRPDGVKYLVQAPTLTPAFDDVDGNQVFKKVIIVATIPTR
tara:strand:+ start:1168 stop:2496 length:1329 start_codon:yes stop_codon:yes gene_type:complete